MVFSLGFVCGCIVGGLVVVYFARKNLNTLKASSDKLHDSADKAVQKITDKIKKN